MKVIGVLCGEEQTFPNTLIEHINGLEQTGVRAEYVKLGAVKAAEDLHYDVIVDRISHDILHYRSVLQNAVLAGTRVVNNPFLAVDDHKFFSYALADRIGVPVPRTVILPSRQHPAGTSASSMRNLIYPLDWRETFDYVGFPAFLKPDMGMGWKNVHRVEDEDAFFHAYNTTGTMAMLLQEAIEFSEYYRCYVIGRKDVHIMPYEPRNPHERRYDAAFAPTPEMARRMTDHAVALMDALAYDCNSIEYAVRDGVPYAIDFLNGAPDAELASVTRPNFDWFVEHMASYLVDLAARGRDESPDYSWSRFLKGGP